jgi:hypothetical protein
MAEELLSSLPKKLSDLEVSIGNFRGDVYDISTQVAEISIYESIRSPFLYGEIAIIDNSAMMSSFPFFGQERIQISWRRDQERTTRTFFVTDVYDVHAGNQNVGTYGLSISSERQMKNAVSLFSRAYNGPADDIINRVHSEFLGQELDVRARAKSEYNVVFPYMKPFQAIDMVRQHAPAEDGTPFFLFESFYGTDGPRLDSLGNMYAQEPIIEIEPKQQTNTDPTGQTLRENEKFRRQIYDYMIPRAYDTLDNIGQGTYAMRTTQIDLTKKTFPIFDYSHLDESPTVAGDHIQPEFTIKDLPLNELYDTRHSIVYQNRYAFDNDLPNLNGFEPFDRTRVDSYLNKLGTGTFYMSMDSMRVTENGETFEVGKTADLKIPKFQPKFDENESIIDKVNSGTYLIMSIRHYFKREEYTFSVEFSRDGIGELQEEEYVTS